MRVLFIYTFFLKQNGEGLSVGGVETYIQNLIPLFESLGCSTIVVQKADFDFVKKYKNSTIVGVKCKGKKYKHVLYKKARTLIDANNDFLIFASDLLNVKNDVKKSICIQHGIYWDKPTFSNNKLYNFRVVNFAKKMREAYEILRWPLLTNRVVCVDYNYLNWYRSMLYYKEPSKRIVPILNFTDIPPLCSSKQSDDKTIKIIFARRFFNYRGTRIFAEAISRVLCKYTNIEVTVSGDGPDENFLIEKLGQFRNVVFTKYDSFESLKVHMDKHIAIVPTLGSEGTSLSLLEAMASSCSVIATNVGGMTNIVLDHYNGVLINPDADELFHSLCDIIENRPLRIFLANNAYASVKTSFSLQRWQSDWKKLIEEFKDEK